MQGPFRVLKPPITLRPKPPAGGEADVAGPVAWWKLDESDGRTVLNAAGTNLAGQLRGPPRWQSGTGPRQGALEFDGTSNWIECPDSTDLNLGHQLSVAVWMRARPGNRDADTLLAKGEAWQLARSRERRELEFALSGPQTTGKAKGEPPRVACPAPPDDGQWHHVAGVYDGSRLVLYLDGVEQAHLPAYGPVAWNNLPVTLGDNAASRGSRWNGWLDDARLYARALSAQEVQHLHAGAGE